MFKGVLSDVGLFSPVVQLPRPASSASEAVAFHGTEGLPLNNRQHPRARTQARLPSRETAPTIQSRLQQRRITPMENPLKGLSEGSTRISWRMNQLGAELSQQFGQMGSNLKTAMNIEGEREVQRLQDERQGLIAQAQIDHARGSPNSSEARSYVQERERLRLGVEIGSAQRTAANDRIDAEISASGQRTGGATIRNGNAARTSYDFFIGRGYNPAQAAAIVGHLNAESSWRTDARNQGDGRDGSDSIGMLQWNAERSRALQAYARQQGKDWRDLTVQLQYLDHEIRNTRFAFQNDRTRQAFMSATTVEGASSAFMHAVRPSGYTERNPRGGHNWSHRRQGAQQVFSSYAGSGGATPAATPQPHEMQAPAGAAAGPAPEGQRTLDVHTPAQVRRNLQTAQEAARGGSGSSMGLVRPGQGITDTLADQVAAEIAQSYATEVLPKVTLSQGYAGSTTALRDHALQVMQGMDDNQRGAILAKLEDRTRQVRTAHFEHLQKQQLATNRSTFDNETARSFLDGQITQPEHVQTLVTRAQDPLIYGDARVARQTVSKRLVVTAIQDMEQNPANAQQTYLRVMQALEPTFQQFPADMGALRSNLLEKLQAANGVAGRQIVNQLGQAAVQGDANALVTTLFENYGTLQQPALAVATGKALEALGKVVEHRAATAAAAAYIEGRPTVGAVDPKVVDEEITNRFTRAAQSNDPAAVHQVINEAPTIPAAVRQQMSIGLNPNSLSAQTWKFDAEGQRMVGAGVAQFEQRYGLLNSLDQRARERVLDPEALAVFNATQTMATALGMPPAVAFQKVQERQRSMNPTEFQRLTREGLRLDEVYVKKPGQTVPEQFDTTLTNAAATVGGSGFRTSVDLREADMAHLRQETRRIAGNMFAATGTITEADMAKAAEIAVRQSYIPVPTGYSRLSGTSVQMRRVDPEVAQQWQATGLSGNPSRFTELTDRARTALPHGIGAGNIVLEGDQDSRGGYLSVREGNYRLPMLIEPGSVRETPAVGTTAAGKVTYPTDQPAFLEQIGRENASLAGTGYRWLEEGQGRYKLVFRPDLQREAPPAEDPRQILGRDLTNVEDAVHRRVADGVRPEQMQEDVTSHRLGNNAEEPQSPLRNIFGRDQTSGGQMSSIIRDVVGRASTGPNAILPRNLGVTIPVPESFDSPQQAIDWLRKAQVTHRLNYEQGRPTTDPQFASSMRQRMQERYGNFMTPRSDADNPQTAFAGARVNLDDQEVRRFLKEQMRLDDRDLIKFREGRPVGDAATWPERRERIVSALTDFGVGRAETTLRGKINPEVLAGMPREAYSVLVGLAYENPSLITKQLAEAADRREWRQVESLIRQAVPQSRNRNIAAATRHYRGVDADLFAVSFGLSPQ